MSTRIVKYDNDILGLDQGMVRAFLILGKEQALLLDAGVERDPGFSVLIRQATDLPVSLCLSHSDMDHIANAGDFDRIFIHSSERERLLAQRPELSDRLIEIDEGYEFDLGGRKLSSIHCPGHTPGSLALLEEERSLLLSGDTVSYGPVYMFGEGRDDKAYLETLVRLEDMYGSGAFQSIYPCHNSCPIDCQAITELIECIKGIMDGSLYGVPTSMRDQEGRRVLEYHVGKSGIYHI